MRKETPGHVTVEKILTDFETRLDPAKPEGGPHSCRVLDYGELTVVLALCTLPKTVLKRISGFRDATEASAYAASVRRYVHLLEERGVSVIGTDVFTVTGKTGVVYLVQPLVDKRRIGNCLLPDAERHRLARLMEQILDCVAALLRANGSAPDGVEVAIDAQISNWYFPPTGPSPLLIDVGTPAFRTDGQIRVNPGFIYRSFPQPIRWVLGRMKVVENYYRDYFDLRLTIIDMLGNFIKEKAAHRLPECVDIVNRWLDRRPDLGHAIPPITIDEIQRYYRSDAALLELSLKARRVTRFVVTRLLSRRYDYILPGKIERC